jgi:signal transduction histidine kinase
LPADVYQTDAEQLLNLICHDLSEPVASMQTTAAAALADARLESRVRRHLEQIAEQAEWLASMIYDCMGTESQGAGKGTGNPPANLVRIVNKAIAACRLAWPGDICVTSPPGPVPCALHPVVLRRVISNLLSNAIRAAGPSGLVMVEVNRSKGMTVLMVEDSGPGFGMIPPGYGIGLAEIARNVISCGGKLECSRGEHGGARVSLWLPS